MHWYVDATSDLLGWVHEGKHNFFPLKGATPIMYRIL